MPQEKVLVTQEGYQELLKEQANLIHVIRKEVIEDLQAARAQGDLSENADYDAARDRQARVEARIRELEMMLNNIEIIDDKMRGSKVVKLGAKIVILDLETNEEESYIIVGSVESDPLNGKLSNVTPMAVALMEHRVGDEVTVGVENPYRVRILSID
ncbi:MAG: transcription elongation factor GreA [Firmicutes bacterium GWF2_51_9]|nr:MAG: transcription elongation factor GreA [Firmicutes bacterium GWF2_51_9]OGS57746.1 MAG: transcription elongation factor GreA [Firmicutes bacterium GWE2_51_13]HAM63005.1 transcription elongation factor GreA [Erysipelotrichaceae bacterium]HBZ40606.1 transcription elongation factor GreA [Erysipelotrichaceae bacterium]